MPLTNEDLRHMFTKWSARNEQVVEADRTVREAVLNAAVAINEALVESPHKEQAIWSLFDAYLRANVGLLRYGVQLVE